MRQGLVALTARDASLRDILTEMSRVSGIQIYLEASVTAEEAATLAFDGLPPEDSVRRVLRARNFILVYSAGALAEVRVYTDGRGEFVRLGAETQPSTSRALLTQKLQLPPVRAHGGPPARPCRRHARAAEPALVRLRRGPRPPIHSNGLPC
jgi:hypothetical protein